MSDVAPQMRDVAPAKSSRWLWFALPIGCLGVSMVVCCGFIATVFWGVSGMLKSSEPYQHALEVARADAEVKQSLGEPIEPGWMIQGSINLNNDDGNCDFQFPVSGPDGSGTLFVEATKTDGVWEYHELSITLDRDNKSKDLLE